MINCNISFRGKNEDSLNLKSHDENMKNRDVEFLRKRNFKAELR